MPFTLFVNDQQSAQRLTFEDAQDAAALFIAKGDSVRIEYRARDNARRPTTWRYDRELSEWVRKSRGSP